jgi:DNA-binding transcriptional ArsR family regulator
MAEKGAGPGLRSVHRALADPLRIRLLEALYVKPRSARELAELVGMPADRLYHHLGQLTAGGLAVISEYRPLPGGKVERVYAPAPVEPPGEDSSPGEVATFLNAVLEATRADVNAASLAQEKGEHREINLSRTAVRLSAGRYAELRASLEKLIRAAEAEPDEDGVWTRIVWAMTDLQPRP